MSISETPSNDEALWLRAERRRKGLHQHQLAARVGTDGINQGRISEFEHGKPIPPELLQEFKRILS